MNYDNYLRDMKRLCGGKWPHNNRLSPMPIFQRRRVNEGKAGMRIYEICAHVDVFDKSGLDIAIRLVQKGMTTWPSIYTTSPSGQMMTNRNCSLWSGVRVSHRFIL